MSPLTMKLIVYIWSPCGSWSWIPTANSTLDPDVACSLFRSCDKISSKSNPLPGDDCGVCTDMSWNARRPFPLPERISELCTGLVRTCRLAAFVISRRLWLHCICTTLAAFYSTVSGTSCAAACRSNAASWTTQPTLPGRRYSPGSSKGQQ